MSQENTEERLPALPEDEKPALQIDLSSSQANPAAFIAAAKRQLKSNSLREYAAELDARFAQARKKTETTYEDLQALAEEYCDIEWF